MTESAADPSADAPLEDKVSLVAPFPATGGPGPTEGKRLNLGTWLVATDVVAAYLGWAGALLLHQSAFAAGPERLAQPTWLSIVGVLLTLAMIYAHGLYLAANCVVRSQEINGLGKATALAGVGVLIMARLLMFDVPLAMTVTAAVLTFLLLVAGRSVYRSWLVAGRRAGRFLRTVVLVGANDEAVDLYMILSEHPELGLRVAGVVAAEHDGSAADSSIDVVAATREAVRKSGATGVLVVASAVGVSQLNPLVRALVDDGIHVHLSSGLRGIAHHRVRTVPFAHQPLLYVERPALSKWQGRIKRLVDLVVASIALLAALPMLAVIAVLIKLEDRGPLLFRQERVGKDGRLFTVYKLRTMVVDAEAKLAELQAANLRGGPLFKMSRDPRITRVGKFLRASSLDEVPQLFNVVQGTMSLVGPRPALPDEVAQFDTELQGRSAVLPGVTGLWQVEARDNPAFGPYRRLDLFYVENWSVGLDISILFATAASVVGRGFRSLGSRRHNADADEPTGVLH